MNRKMQVAKVLASSLVLLGLGMVILVGKKPALFAYKKDSIPAPFTAHLRNTYIPINNYGGILSSKRDQSSRVHVEHVAVHVPKHKLSEEKITRFGRLVWHPQAEATILICHGFMCDKFDVGFLRNMFPQGRFNFMTFDFRAHGENCVGQRCTLGRDEALDVIHAAHFIKNHPKIGAKPIIAYAFSMGAVAAIEAQAQDSSLFKAMILDCPFDSSENMVKRSLESLQFTILGYDFSIPACNLLQKYAFHPYVQSLIKGILKTVSNFDTKNIDVRVYPISPAESIQKINVPCFFIHCKNDEKISIDAIRSVYDHAGTSYKKLWLTNGRRHFDSYFYNPEKYIKELRGFIDTVVSAGDSTPVSQEVIEDPDEPLLQM